MNDRQVWLNESELNKLNKDLQEILLNKMKLFTNKMQLFSWHIDVDKFSMDEKEDINGPTLLYTSSNNEIAFDSFCRRSSDNFIVLYFRLLSMPQNLKRIVVSFYLYCADKHFYAEICDKRMSMHQNENIMVGQKCLNINELQNDMNGRRITTWELAVKITQYK